MFYDEIRMELESMIVNKAGHIIVDYVINLKEDDLNNDNVVKVNLDEENNAISFIRNNFNYKNLRP